MEISSTELCDGIPNEFVEFLEYIKNLGYNEKPEYEMLRHLFDNIMEKNKFNYDYIYDWTTLEEKESRKNNRSKTEPTNGDTLSFQENEKKVYDNNIINFNNYHIKRNCKLLENNFTNQESPVCCSSTCLIF